MSSSSRMAASSSQRAFSSSQIASSVCDRPHAAVSFCAPKARRSQSCPRTACCTASKRAAWLRTGVPSGGRSSSQWPSVSTRGNRRGRPAARAAASSASRTPGICAAVGTTTCAPASGAPQRSRKNQAAVAACSRKSGPGRKLSDVMGSWAAARHGCGNCVGRERRQGTRQREYRTPPASTAGGDSWKGPVRGARSRSRSGRPLSACRPPAGRGSRARFRAGPRSRSAHARGGPGRLPGYRAFR